MIKVLTAAFVLLALATPARAQQPFKVGVILPLTGAYAEYGEATRRGIELSQEEAPDLFRSVSFTFEDDHYDPKTALAAFEKLTALKDVALVIVWGNESALAVAPLAETRAVPLLAFSQNPHISRGRSHIVRMLNPADDYAEKMASHLFARGLTRVAIVKSETSFFNILVDALIQRIGPAMEVEVLDAVLPSDHDFRTIITKLKSRRFDAIGVYLTPPQVVEFYKAADAQRFQPVTFGTTPFESKTVIEHARGLMEGAVYVHNDVQEIFRKSYLRRFKTDIQISYAALAFDCARIAAAVRSDSRASEIGRALSLITRADGASGHYGYRSSADQGAFFHFDLVMKKIVNGEAIALKD